MKASLAGTPLDTSRQKALAYGLCTLAITVQHNIFLLHYVDMFVSVYRISASTFYWGQFIFWIWNSCNDPLFAWFSDKILLSSPGTASGGSKHQQRVSQTTILRRISAIAIGGPGMSLFFLSFWFSWTPFLPLHFVVSLCAYDGFLTFVDLNHQALLADLALHVHERAQLSRFSSIGSLVGSLSVFFSYAFWNASPASASSASLPAASPAASLLDGLLGWSSFQYFCIALALISAASFLVSALSLRRILKSQQPHGSLAGDHDDQSLGSAADVAFAAHLAQTPSSAAGTLLTFVRQMLHYKNFLVFTVVSLVQTFHCHFNSNFFPLFLSFLLRDSLSPSVGSFLLGVSFLMPHLNNIYFTTLSEKHGVYAVIRALVLAKLVLAATLLMAGTGSVLLLALFILSNRVFTEGTCKLLSLVISDLVDEDYIVHHRRQAVSALIFGSTNFVSKAGQSLAPVVGTWLLTSRASLFAGASGGDKESGLPLAPIVDSLGAIDSSIMSSIERFSPEQAQAVMFGMLIFVPVCCAVVQLTAWRLFTLHGDRLEYIKQAIVSKESDSASGPTAVFTA